MPVIFCACDVTQITGLDGWRLLVSGKPERTVRIVLQKMRHNFGIKQTALNNRIAQFSVFFCEGLTSGSATVSPLVEQNLGYQRVSR